MKVKITTLLLLSWLVTIGTLSYATVDAPPYLYNLQSRGVNDNGDHRIFSTPYADGEYSQASHTVEITFKENIDNVEIIIYKDGIVCELDAGQDVQKDDFKNYLLNKYGSGEYTICIKINNQTEITRSFKW